MHVCGHTSRILADMAASGAEIADVAWMVDLRQAAEAFSPHGPAPCGLTLSRSARVDPRFAQVGTTGRGR